MQRYVFFRKQMCVEWEKSDVLTFFKIPSLSLLIPLIDSFLPSCSLFWVSLVSLLSPCPFWLCPLDGRSFDGIGPSVLCRMSVIGLSIPYRMSEEWVAKR